MYDDSQQNENQLAIYPTIFSFYFIWTFCLYDVCESRTRKEVPMAKFVGAEIKRLTMLMQFVVNDMFHNNYLFKFSPSNSLWFLFVRQHLHSAALQRNFPGLGHGKQTNRQQQWRRRRRRILLICKFLCVHPQNIIGSKFYLKINSSLNKQ